MMRAWAIGIAAIMFLSTSALPNASDVLPSVPPNVLQLLRSNDQIQIKSKLEISKPILTFHQQFLVLVRYGVAGKPLRKSKYRQLHFVLRVKDEQGNWYQGAQYSSFEVPEQFKNGDIEFSTSVYLRPGTYQFAIGLLESATGHANVNHLVITVPPPKKDRIPQINELLPPVEFPASMPDSKGMWPISLQMARLSLPGRNRQLDILLNVTKASRSDWLYRRQTEEVLAIGSVLGRLSLPDGCVRVSVIDALRTKIVLDRQNADQIDWGKLQASIEELDQNTIDISALENQRRVAEFTQRFIEGLARDTKGCTSSPNEEPVTAVISADLVLPLGAKIPRSPLRELTDVYYFHVGTGSAWMDGVGQILSSAKARKMNCSNPLKAREGIAEFITSLSTVAD